MMTKLHTAYIAGGILAACLAFGPPALAQQKGVTSGPAVGTDVVPSTTAQKEDPALPAGSGKADPGVQRGAVGVGAPGVAAKSGSEGGTSPGPDSGKRP